MTEPTDGHSHDSAWGTTTGVFIGMAILIAGAFIGQQHQFDVIYDRVGEMQRQLECPPGELLVTDHDDVEYCLAPEEDSE